MQYSACQFVVNKIVTGWRAGLSVFLLLNLALLQAVATPIAANNATPSFNKEIKSAGHSLQRELPRINLHNGSEIANGNNDDTAADAAISASLLPHFKKVLLSASTRPDANRSNGRYAYFLPEPRAAPQA
ncbi:MAG: hypothetical protein RQ732_08205 [Methylophaga sp.]|nr:hypothetical protein [Methylophaga sp.]